MFEHIRSANESAQRSTDGINTNSKLLDLISIMGFYSILFSLNNSKKLIRLSI